MLYLVTCFNSRLVCVRFIVVVARRRPCFRQCLFGGSEILLPWAACEVLVMINSCTATVMLTIGLTWFASEL